MRGFVNLYKRYLLVVEQLLEIIFTLLTLKVPCEAEEPPAAPAPAPALPLTLPLGLVELAPLLGLVELLPLGLVELAEPLALPLASEPLIRT